LTGRLRQSIAWTKPVWRDANTIESTIGTNVAYARRLEYGGTDKRGVRIEKRQYWEPTFLRCEAKMNAMLAAL
jgi:phage gpG-like protein